MQTLSTFRYLRAACIALRVFAIDPVAQDGIADEALLYFVAV
jgi:hypothetical protein